MRAAIYIIETASSKKPNELDLGKRHIIEGKNKILISKESIMIKNDSFYDGHINRNIRASLALIESTKPYIKVVGIRNVSNSDKIEIKWVVNGCFQID